MDKDCIKKGNTIYLLDRNAWNVNDPEALIVEMTIIEKDGELYAHAKQGYSTMEFHVSADSISEMNKPQYKILFETRAAAQAHYEESMDKQVQAIHDMSQEELIKLFFNEWRGEYMHDIRIDEAMREKIKNEFKVHVG
ncbi:hypothetical protein [Evansella clarkii]|uniref:hypothetical protein n=1 Tax=Evansella clarkii TaxID=79879 RepID=UPI0009980ABC|nr:hypothetical protein [Evansella clarkii]